MTTSGPQTDPDDAREHRSIGQRIRDAVLGDADETRRDRDDVYTDEPVQRSGDVADPTRAGADPGYAEPGTDHTNAGYPVPAHDQPAGASTVDTNAGYEDAQDSEVRSEAGYADPGAGTATGYDEPRGARTATGYDEPRGARTDAGYDDAPSGAGRPEPGYADAGYDDARRDEVGPEAGFTGSPAGTAAGYDEPRTAGPQAGYDDAPRGGGHDANVGTLANPEPSRADDPGYGQAQRSDVQGAGGEYVDTRPGQGLGDEGRVPGDRDLVTSSYDPERDSGYDPQAAGTAIGTGDAPSGGGRGEVQDAESRDYATRDYEPTTDTGYRDEGAGVPDRTIGSGDADYDTGRVDTGRVDTGRVDTGRVDTGRVDTARDAGAVDPGGYGDSGAGRESAHAGGIGTAGAVAAGGVAAAAGVAAVHHHRRDDDPDAGRFSDVDDTATVDPTATGQATTDTRTADRDDVPLAGATGDAPGGARTGDDPYNAPVGGATAAPSSAPVSPAPGGTTTVPYDAPTETAPVGAPVGGQAGDAAEQRRAEAVSDADDDAGGRERLVPVDRADSYSSRWDALKGDFVDEPRRAVTQADQLVGEVLDDIQRLFTDQRRDLDAGFDHDQASTEDLRLALRRYRSFFDRLLSL